MDKKIPNEEVEKKKSTENVETARQQNALEVREATIVKEENTGVQIQKEKERIRGEEPGATPQDDDTGVKTDLQSENRLAALIKLVELKKVSVPDAIKQAEKGGADVLDRFHDLLVEKGFGKESQRSQT